LPTFLNQPTLDGFPKRPNTWPLADTAIQDNSDAQYRSFRLNLPALGALMAAFFALKYAYMRPVLGVSTPTDSLHRLPFYIISSLLMLTILHGASILKVLCILSINYAIAKATGGTRLAIPATWIFNGGVLFANEWYEGYSFATLHSGLAFLVRPASAFSLVLLTVLVTGWLAWRISALARQLQYHHVTPCLVQH